MVHRLEIIERRIKHGVHITLAVDAVSDGYKLGREKQTFYTVVTTVATYRGNEYRAIFVFIDLYSVPVT